MTEDNFNPSNPDAKITQTNVIPLFLAAANDETPGDKLREIADDYESGKVKGVIVTYVTDDGEVRYKLMGALAKTGNLGNALAIAGELKRRLELISVGFR
ncbi:hypothetical protein PP715_03155 [Ralstonia solanacearum]|uniref:Uncharacterized protein n=1 Tax=Ralstonia solanacearum TaxID=305 RepID=A0A5H2PK46_RALSL|nr:hypothetical protein [Ralstonia solanacearum]AMP69561.1 hypothetical protein UW163_08810 [Ralstonia solanacearum]AYB59941.1 hypothetical protein C2124_04725 [Ralstonia solanacearum]MBB6586742.1 hypothetical protein [Ralstonia solanacearum]MCG3573312.1 hypothetical protein [Ralstonia solanacearum]MCL9839535.1 hypothetical protein [Ralstonia solanacearum]